MEEISFMNLVFRGLSREVLLRDSPEMKIVVTVNAEFVVLANEDDIFKKIICDNYSTLDGQIPFALARWKFPGRRIEKISGSDFIYDICLNAKQFDRKVFLLGGYPASNRRAVSVIRDRYGITVEGFSPEYQPYPFSEMHNRTILDYIEKFRPHFCSWDSVLESKSYGSMKTRFFLRQSALKWRSGWAVRLSLFQIQSKGRRA
jgi:N-acetylglucosaminyldiphosphoundecaprenol N-acetyl-beta-D-mannosaminyltransferase